MKNNYLKEVLKVFIATIVLLLLFGLIPDFEFKYKHFDLLSDIRTKDTSHVNLSVTDKIQPEADISSSEIVIDGEKSSIVANDSAISNSNSELTNQQFVAIEDFSPDKKSLGGFFDHLRHETVKRPVRIGVLGDSFIEADIFTADLRKQLQAEYGGRGVGFVPVASPAAQYRKTVQHTFSGWTATSMIHYKNADWKKFCLSGFYFTPVEDAFVSLKTAKEDTVKRAVFFFINQKNTKINVSVNNKPIKEYTPESSDSLQFLSFEDEALCSVSVSVSKVDGFTAFGLYLGDPTGIYVDNFSVRGSSGSVLTTINKDISRMLSAFYPYDLIILQHGLNVISPDRERYPAYKKLMINTVRHIHECYPDVPVIMMSVGDKGYKDTNGFSTHPGVMPLVAIQREIAQETGIMFWNTFDAMGGKNSMSDFVNHKPPMAAKDYTHINYLGGKEIADRFFESLEKEKVRLIPNL